MHWSLGTKFVKFNFKDDQFSHESFPFFGYTQLHPNECQHLSSVSQCEYLNWLIDDFLDTFNTPTKVQHNL